MPIFKKAKVEVVKPVLKILKDNAVVEEFEIEKDEVEVIEKETETSLVDMQPMVDYMKENNKDMGSIMNDMATMKELNDSYGPHLETMGYQDMKTYVSDACKSLYDMKTKKDEEEKEVSDAESNAELDKKLKELNDYESKSEEDIKREKREKRIAENEAWIAQRNKENKERLK